MHDGAKTRTTKVLKLARKERELLAEKIAVLGQREKELKRELTLRLKQQTPLKTGQTIFPRFIDTAY